MPREPMPDVIVILPGILGSVLEKDGQVVWGFSGRSIATALFTRGAALREALMLEADPPDQDDLGDGTLVRVGETDGIPNIDPQRAAASLSFHREIEAAVDAHLKVDQAYFHGRYSCYPIVGLDQETAQSARRNGDTIEMLSSHNGEDLSGDGTVPRVSAIPIEYSNAKIGMFASTRHGSLQNADVALTQLRGIISGQYVDLGAFRGPIGKAKISLSVDDLLLDTEPLEIRARPSREEVELTATISGGPDDDMVARLVLAPSDDGWHSATNAPLPAGAYRVRITGQDVDPAQDSFAVGTAQE